MSAKENELILGIDPSLNSSGVCILDSRGKIVHVESFNPSPLVGYERLSYIYKRYCSLLETFKYVSYVGFEKQLPQQRYNFNAKYILSLAENIGVLKLSLCNVGRNIKVYEFLPTEIKKNATGNSKAEKKDMESVLGVRIINNIKSNIIDSSVNDVVDAYHAAVITFDTLNGKYEETKYISYEINLY